MKKRSANIIVSTLIAFIICYFLLKGVELKAIFSTLISIPFPSLAIGFVIYAIFIFLKAVRFNLLLREAIPLGRLYPIVSLYTFFGNFLPMRSGDLSYVYLLKKREQVPMVRSTASLLIASVWELLFLLLIAALSAWSLRSVLSGRLSLAILFFLPLIGSLIVVLSLFSASAFPNFWLKTSDKISSTTQIPKSRILQKVILKSSEFVKELGNMSIKSGTLWVAISSFAVVASRFGVQCYLVKAMNLDIGLLQSISALSFTTFLNLIPLHGIAGFGNLELPWVLVLTAYHLPQESAILSGFSLHILILCYSVVAGAYGLVAGLKRAERR